MERLVDLLGTHCSFGLLGVTIPRYYSTHETKDFSIYLDFHLVNNLFLVNNTLFNCSRVEACSLLICNITCFCWSGRLAIGVDHCCLICILFRYFWQYQQVGNVFVSFSGVLTFFQAHPFIASFIFIILIIIFIAVSNVCTFIIIYSLSYFVHTLLCHYIFIIFDIIMTSL